MTDRAAAARHLDLASCALDAVRRAGAVGAGLAGVGELDAARSVIESRRDAGLNDEMSFTFRNPARSSDPTSGLPSARSALVAAFPYGPAISGPVAEPTAPADRDASAALVGEVALYAAEHAYEGLHACLEAGAAVLREAGHRAVIVSDDNALVDRAMAVRAGIGWTGKNSNILVPGAGSWVVLGSVLTDAELSGPVSVGDVPAEVPVRGGCGPCTRCLEGCPTGALPAPGVLDATRCLSWLLQRTGSFPRRFRVALGTRIYGCDECQVVCPPSQRRAPSGAEAQAGPEGAEVDLVELLESADGVILERFGSWYIPRRDVRYVRRNALVALGNALAAAGDRGARAAEAVLSAHLGCDDPLLVEHAAWAARRALLEDLLDDPRWSDHPEVLAERPRPHPALEEALAVRTTGRETPLDGPERR